MFMKRLPAFLTLLMVICALTSYAQTKEVTGRVTEESTNLPIPGVTIEVKGTTTATITDSAGYYRLSVPENATTLSFSYVGHVTKEMPLDRSIIDVVLGQSTTSMDDVVVIGYGTQRKRDVTGAISKVSGAQITAIPAPSFEASLQGKAPGVQVIQGSGMAGSSSVIRIRGIGSISANGDPLYVIDGIPVTSDPFLRGSDGGMNSNPLAAINPNDIESVEILKDAGAAGIYGSRGANGVILITTKRGKGGRAQFNYSNKLGLVSYANRPDFVNTPEYLKLLQEAWENDGKTGVINETVIPGGLTLEQASKTNNDWWDRVTRTGYINEHNLSMTQGKGKWRTFIGATYSMNESYIKNNAYERQAIRANVDYKASNKFKVSLNAAHNRGINNRIDIFKTISAAQSNIYPFFPVYSDNGEYFDKYNNPTAYLNETKYRNADNRLLGGLTLEYEPIKNLVFRAVGSADYLASMDDRWESATWTGNTQQGAIAKRYPLWVTNYNTTITGSYQWNLNTSNRFNFLAGVETQESETRNTNNDIYAWGLDAPFYKGNVDLYRNRLDTLIGSGERKKQTVDNWTFNSFFARINYTLDNKYNLQLLARLDGSSRFGPNNKRGFFPAASASWLINEEDFLKDVSFINVLKLRASYGIVGNSSIASGQYYYGYNSSNTYNGIGIWSPSNLGNPDLKWETLRNFDLGLDFSLFNNRLSGEIAYYHKITVDQLVQPGVAASMGFQRSWRNLEGGKILNEGVEFSLNAKLVDQKDWGISIGGNISKNYNEVLTIGSLGPDALQGGYNDTRIAAGYPVGSNFLVRYYGADPADGLPIWLDKNGKQTKTFSLDHRVLVGNVLPDYMGGINSSVRFKTIEFTTLWTYVIGGNIYDGSAKYSNLGNKWNIRRDLLDRWQEPGDVAKYPRLTTSVSTYYPGLGTNDNYNSTMFLYDASYTRLREATVSYTFPSRNRAESFFKGAKIAVTGMNLLTFTKYPGSDPEIARDFQSAQDRNMSPNVTYLTPPQARSFILSLNLNF